MFSHTCANTSVTRRLSFAVTLLIVLFAPAMRGQSSVPGWMQIQQVCSAPPSPSTDVWPVANADDLGTTTGAPVVFTGATLLANDVSASLLTISTPIDTVPYAGGTVTGTDPFTYTRPPAFSGTDVFSYEVTDMSGRKATGIVKVTVMADVTAPQVGITAPAAGQVSGTVLVTATAFDAVGVVGVRFFVDGAPLGGEDSTPPYAASWDTAPVADGTHTLTATASDAAGNVGTSAGVAVNVSNPVAATPPSVDTMAFSDGLNKRTTPAFNTTRPGDVLVAFAASDGPAAVNSQTLTIAGAGLTWSRVKRAASRFGVAEIWTATATGLLSNVTVSSTQTVTGYQQSLTVIAFSGVAGIGASSTAGAVSGAPTVGLVTTANGSLVYAVGNDWDRALARVVPAGQTKVRERVNATVGDTFWVQAITGAIPSAGTAVTLNVTSPTTDQWNFAAVELRAGAAAPPPPPPADVTVPNVVGLSDTAARSAITTAGLTVGTVSSEYSASVLAGQVIRQTPAADGSAAPGSAVGFVLSLGPAPTTGGPVVDAQVSSDGAGARTTTPFNTTAPTVLVALVGSDGPTPSEGPNNQFLTVSGAGLAWTRVVRAAGSRGVSEIWTATAPAALTNVTVTSTQSVTLAQGLPVNQSLTVVAFTGASGIGASNIASASTGAPTVNVVAQAAGSAVYAMGNDFDRAVVRTIPAGQVKVHEFLAPSGDTMWAQALVGTSSAAGTTVTLQATAPNNDQWNFAIVEIKR